MDELLKDFRERRVAERAAAAAAAKKPKKKKLVDAVEEVAAPEPIIPVRVRKAPRPKPLPEPPRTKKVLVRPSFGVEPLFIDMPEVEYRFVNYFGETQNAEPGLTMTADGTVYLVSADGTRTPLSGGGGGGGFPTFFQLAEPSSPAAGDTWMRPAGGYPDTFGVGAFYWVTGDAPGWVPISGTVALDDDGNVLGIVSVGQNDGNIVIEKYAVNEGDPSSSIVVYGFALSLVHNDGSGASGILLANGGVVVGTATGSTFSGADDGNTTLVVQTGAEADGLAVTYNNSDTALLVGDDTGGVQVGLKAGYGFTVLGTDAEVVALQASLDGENNPTVFIGGPTTIQPSGDVVALTLNGTSLSAGGKFVSLLNGESEVFAVDVYGSAAITPVTDVNALAIDPANLVDSPAIIVGANLFVVGPDGGVVVNPGGTAKFLALADGISFFGADPVEQQPTPVLLSDVIALLQAYGLAA